MKTSDKKRSIFEIIDEELPLWGFQTKHGYLKFNEKQKLIIKQKIFTPNKYVFASATIDRGIQFYERSADNPVMFEKYIQEYEEDKDNLPFTYLGVSDEEGKVSIETLM